MNTAFKRTLLSTLVVPFALGAAYANAAPISSWNYEVDSSFSSASFTTGGGTQDISDENVISWGGEGEDNRSSVAITDVDSVGDGLPAVETNGDAVNGGVFSHTNNAIAASFATVESFDLTSTLTLMPIPSEAGNTEVLPSITFNTRFTETLNNPDDGTCADGLPEPCGDIFTVVSVEGLGPFTNGGLPPQQFVQGDYLYSVFLELDGLSELSDSACAAAGAGAGCVGLLTPEGGTNTFQSSFRITAQAVPEPGTLALLGLGLAGLGLSRRKKAAKA